MLSDNFGVKANQLRVPKVAIFKKKIVTFTQLLSDQNGWTLHQFRPVGKT